MPVSVNAEALRKVMLEAELSHELKKVSKLYPSDSDDEDLMEAALFMLKRKLNDFDYEEWLNGKRSR